MNDKRYNRLDNVATVFFVMMLISFPLAFLSLFGMMNIWCLFFVTVPMPFVIGYLIFGEIVYAEWNKRTRSENRSKLIY